MMSFTFLREGNAHGNSRLQADGKREYIVYHVDLDSGAARVEDTSSRSIQRGIFDLNGERYAEILRDSERRTYEMSACSMAKRASSSGQMWPARRFMLPA